MAVNNMSVQGVPLRPDRDAVAVLDRRSFFRAAAAAYIGHRDRTDPVAVLRRTWADDSAERVLRAAMAPTSTSDFPAAQANRVLPLLSPSSASARLLSLATSFDMRGYATIAIPWIGTNTIPLPLFVGEGLPIPVTNLTTAKSILADTQGRRHRHVHNRAGQRQRTDGRNHHLAGAGNRLRAGARCRALQQCRCERDPASRSAQQSDATSVRSRTGVAGAAADIGALADAIGQVANSDAMVLITSPGLAARLRILANPTFDNLVLSSDGDSCGRGDRDCDRRSGYRLRRQRADRDVHRRRRCILKRQSRRHCVGAGVPANPTRSAFQDAFSSVRVICRCSWIALPGAVAYLTGANW